MIETCSEYVPHGTIGAYCRKKPITLINGKYYCKLHEPSRVNARVKKREDSYNKNRKEWQIKHNRDMFILGLFGRIDIEVIKKNEAFIKDFISKLT